MLFTGQRKQPVADLLYEIPTLIPAPLLNSALERLRHRPALRDCSALTLNQISQRYGPKVRETARETFGNVLPARAGKQQIAAHDLRAAYARIAVHWYCPPEKSDRLYAATILGHVQGAASEEEAFERMASEEHYADYLIDDGQGNQNGAKGVKLGAPGVVVLKAFQSDPEPDRVEIQNGGTPPVQKKKKRASTGRSLLNVHKDARERVVARKFKRGMTSENDVIVELLDHREAEERSREQLTPERFGLPSEAVEEIRQGLVISHEQDFRDFLKKALVKEARIRIGTAQRNKEVDLTQLRTSELEKLPKSAEVTGERIRRAVITLMLYNQQQSDPKHRAALTQNAVHDLIGGRFDHIRDFLTTHQQVIAQHQTQWEVPEKRSSKVKLGDLQIPEEPEVFQGLLLSGLPQEARASS